MNHQLKNTWQHIRRSPYQTLAAIMIMTLTLFVGVSFVLLSLGSQKVLTYLEQKPQVIVFFNDTITRQDQVQNIIDSLDTTNKAASVKFVSKEQALEIYKQRSKNDPLLLELVSANTLPASIEVSAKNVSDLPQLYEIVKVTPNVEDISYQKDVVDSLIGVLDKIRKIGIGVIVFLVATSLFIIITIIGMKIALRKEEIEVERLVGATSWYIRLPFLFEGLFYGVVGAITSWVIIYAAILALTPFLAPYLSGLSILPVSPVLMLIALGVSITSGGVVGMVGSFLAVWRYLKS